MNDQNDFTFEQTYENIRQIQPKPTDSDPYIRSQQLLFEGEQADTPVNTRKAASRRQTISRNEAPYSRDQAASRSERSALRDQPVSGNSRSGLRDRQGMSSSRARELRRRKSRNGMILAALISLSIGAAAGLGGGYMMWGYEKPYTVDLRSIETPSWIKPMLIRKNIFSRPDVSMKQINNIVLHYVANPGSSAEANRNYFDSLADQDPQKGGTSASSHFIVGLEGEIIQCIPIREMAYANAPRNNDTVTIEVCHPDETGKFNQDTYDSVVKLTAWLCLELELTPDDVLRHYDINGKACPKYFVDDEAAWKQFLEDVEDQMKYL